MTVLGVEITSLEHVPAPWGRGTRVTYRTLGSPVDSDGAAGPIFVCSCAAFNRMMNAEAARQEILRCRREIHAAQRA